MKLRIVALLLIFLNISFARVSNGVTLGVITHQDPGDSYIELSPNGVITVLNRSTIQPSALQGTDESPVGVFQSDFVVGERVISQPFFFPQILAAGVSHIVFLSKVGASRFLWVIDCDETIASGGLSCKKMDRLSLGSDEKAVFAAYNGLYYFKNSNLYRYNPRNRQESLESLSSSQIPEFASVNAQTFGDVVSVRFARTDGSNVEANRNAQGAWSFQGAWSGALPSGSVLAQNLAIETGADYALTTQGEIYSFSSSNQSWSLIAGPSEARKNAELVKAQGTYPNAMLMLILADGNIQEIDVQNGAATDHIIPSTSVQAVAIRDMLGNPISGSVVKVSTGPDGFYEQTGIQFFVRGRYHHSPALEIIGFVSHPKYFSRKNFTSVDMSFAIAGNPNSDTCFLDLISDTAGTIAIPSIVTRQAISSGIQYSKLTPALTLPDGQYWLRLNAYNSIYSVRKDLPLQIDNNPPVNSVSARLLHPLSASDPDLFVAQHLVISPRQELALDFSSTMDSAPFADRPINIQIQLQDSVTGQTYDWSLIKYGQDSLRPACESLTWVFNGLTVGGMPLPDGVYTYHILAQDSAQNTSDTLRTLSINGTAFSKILINRRSALMSGRVRPLVVTRAVDFRPSFEFNIQGAANRHLTMSVKYDGIIPLMSALDSSTMMDMPIILDNAGVFSIHWPFDVDSTQEGKHYIQVELENEYGFVQIGRYPFVVGKFNTIIVSPAESDTIHGQTEIRGIATAPQMDSLDFSQYRSYYVLDTHLVVPKGLKSEAELLALSNDWKPSPIPLANQSANDPNYPNSNKGIVDNTANGVLSYFLPPVSVYNGQKITLLVYSLSKKDANGLQNISYDTKHIIFGRLDTASDSIAMIVNAVNPTAHDSLNLTDSRNTNDSLGYSFIVKGAATFIDLTIKGASGAVLQKRIYSDSKTPTEFWFGGHDFTNRFVASGKYEMHAEAWVESEKKLLKYERDLFVSIPLVPDTSSVLSIGPNPVDYDPGSGIQPTVTFDVKLNQPTNYYLDVFHGATQIQIVDTTTGRGGTYTWDFRNNISGGGFLLSNISDTAKFTARLTVLSGNTVESTIFKDFIVVPGAPVVSISQSLFTDKSEGDTLLYPMRSDFKFRGIMNGTLRYYPDRALDYALRVQGSQILKNHLPVPYGVKYRKYYANVDIVTDATYKTRYRALCLVHDSWEDGEDGVVGAQRRVMTGEPAFLGSPSDSVAAKTAYNQAVPNPVWYMPNKFTFPKKTGMDYNCGTGTNEDCSGLGVSDRIDFTKEYYSCDEVWRQKEIKSGNLNSYFWREVNVPPSYKDTSWIDTNINATRDTVPNSNPKIIHITYDTTYVTMSMQIPIKTPSFEDPRGQLWYAVNFTGKSGNQPLFLEDALDVERPNSYTETIYWAGDEAWNLSSNSDYNFSGSDPGNFEEDKKQRLYVKIPKFNYEHSYLSPEGFVQDTLNFLEGTPFNSFYNIQDAIPWESQSSTGANCSTITVKIDGVDTTFQVCNDSRGGKKFGDVGFAYQPDFSMVMHDKNGSAHYSHEYIQNFWRKDVSGGHMNMVGSTHDLLFNPKIDTSNAMFGITWDTLRVLYPFTNATEGDHLDRYNNTNKIIAYKWKEGVNSFPFTGDPLKYLNLSVKKFPTGSQQYLDSAELPFINAFSEFRTLLDRTTPGGGELKHYGYVDSNSLDFTQTSFKGLYKNIAGEWVLEGALGSIYNKDTAGMYYRVDTIGRGLNSKIKVYYLKHPVELGTWSSALDAMFSGTSGYLYGSSEFNSKGFRSQDAAMDSVGFLGLVGTKGLVFPAAAPALASPFTLDTTGGANKLTFNPNLDTKSLRWALEVYYYDGFSVNEALDSVASSKDNFMVRLNLNATPKNFIGVPGSIPSSIQTTKGTYQFVDYSVFNLENADSNGIRRQVFLPVNRFYRSDTSALTVGTILPNKNNDFWSKDSTPILAYWDVTHRNGFFPVYIQAHYKNITTGELVSVIQSRTLKVGEVVSDPATEFVVNSPYKRATMTMAPPLAKIGDQISIYPVAFKDLKLKQEAPEVVPVGPVLEILTTGSRNFTGVDKKPELTYRYSAREIYTLNNLTNFDDPNLKPKPVFDKVKELMGQYRIYMLSEDGALDPQVTIAEPQYSDNKEDIFLELRASVNHFSYALVLNDTVSMGAMPKIISVLQSGDSVVVEGEYGSQTVLQNLILKVSKANHLADSSAHLLTKNILVQADQTFRVSFPASVLVEGENWIYVKYTQSPNAAKKLFFKEPTRLLLTGWTDGPDPVSASCGTTAHTVHATANADGSMLRVVRSSTNLVLATQKVSFTRGAVSIGWDGCLDGLPLSSGQYYHEFRNLNGDSTLQILDVTVGNLQTSEVLSVGVDHNPFQPNPSAAFHSLKVSAMVRNMNASDFVLQIRVNGTAVVSLTPTMTGTTTEGYQIWTATWNGMINNTLAAAGVYEAVAYDTSSFASPKSAHFVVGSLVMPIVKMVQQPDTLLFPVWNGGMSVVTDSAIEAQLWLETSTGSLFARLMGGGTQWQAISALSRVGQPFYVSDSSKPMPVRAILAWKSASGFGAMDTLPLVWNKVSMKVDVKSTTTDTLFVGVPEQDVQNYGNHYASAWKIEFETNISGNVSFVVSSKGKSNSIAVPVTAGLNTWVWEGRMDTSLVEEGSTLISLYAKSSVNVDDSILVKSWTVQIKRVPKVVVSFSNDPALNPHMQGFVGDSFTAQLRLELALLGVKRMMILDAKGTESYMGSSTKGVVAFVNEVIDSTLHSGNTNGIVHQFVQSGGKVGFLNTLPLELWGKNQHNGLESSVPLYGYDVLSQSKQFKTLATQLFVGGQTVNSVNPGLGSSLVWPYDNGGTLRPETGMGVNLSLVESQGSNAVGFFFGNGAPAYSMGQFVRPQWIHGNPLSSGSFLSLYPYHRSVSLAEVPKLAKDYAKVLYSFFLASDLSVSNQSIQVMNSDASIDSLRRGDVMQMTINIGYMGENPMSNIKIRLEDKLNSWVDTVVLPSAEFGKVNQVTALVPIGAQWAFDTNTIDVKVIPFAFDTVIDGISERIVETDSTNNLAKVRYVIEDTVPPVIDILSLLQINSSKLKKAYSGLPGTWPIGVEGTVATNHHKGTVQLQINWIGQGGGILVNTSKELSATATAPFAFSLAPTGVVHGNVDTLRLVATDKYGNGKELKLLVDIDRVAPTIDSISVLKALGSELDSTKNPAMPRFVLGSDLPLLYLKGSDNIGTSNAGLWGYTLVDPKALTVIQDSSFNGVSSKIVSGADLANNINKQLIANGNYTLSLVDRGGNTATKAFSLVVDNEKPVIRVYDTKHTTMDQIRAGLLDSIATVQWLRNRPLYEFNPIRTSIDDNGVTTVDSNNTRGEPMPGAATLIAQAKGNSENRYDPGAVDTLALTIDQIDESSVTLTVAVDGRLWAPDTMNPYISGTKALADSLKNALKSHRFERYLVIPMLGTQHDVVITSTDLARNVSTLHLIVGKPPTGLQAIDPQGDQTSGSADLGEVYMSQNPVSADSTDLFVMLHSYNGGRIPMERNHVFYFDLDNDSTTGSPAIATSSAGRFMGFDYKYEIQTIDSLDDGAQNVGIFSKFDGSNWVALTGASLAANQLDRVWTLALGEGHQVTPQNRVARAPGGVVEFRMRLPGIVTALKPMRWFVAGPDMVYDTTANLPYAYDGATKGARVVDGSADDWYAGTIPLMRKMRNVSAAVGNTVLGNGQNQLSFTLENTGLAKLDTLVMRYFVNSATCAHVRLLDDGSDPTLWRLGHDQFRAATELPGLSGAPATLNYLELHLSAHKLTPGSRWTDLLKVRTLDQVCSPSNGQLQIWDVDALISGPTSPWTLNPVPNP